jgi:hypothetical protein
VSDSLAKIRLFMETAEGTEYGLEALLVLAEKHRGRLAEEETPLEAIKRLSPEKAWAVLMASGIIAADGFLDKSSEAHVLNVAEYVYDHEIDFLRSSDDFIEKENEASAEESAWVTGSDDPVYLDAELADD